MNFDKESRPDGVSPITGEVLTEAMPWIKNATGKTIVIKYGGAAMVDEQLRAAVMADIVLLKIIGVNPVIVHGGGKAISRAMEAANVPVEFIEGQRVTTDDVMGLVRTVLTGEVNQELVEAMNRHGKMAVGLSGADANTIVATQADPRLGRVGRITHINSELVEDLVAADYIPLIASIAAGEDGGCYNINADLAAGHIAAAIGAHKVIFLTDVDGLYADFPDQDSLVSNMTLAEAQDMIKSDKISTGMIPKLTAIDLALSEGVHRAHIVNGTTPHALLLEVLTNKGIGTMVTGPAAVPHTFNASPMGNFATKLRVD